MAKQKTNPTKVKVEEYIQTLPSERKIKEAHFVLNKFKEITSLEPVMWGPSIIGFGSYEYTYESGHSGKTALMAFSPRKTKLVLYVLTNFKGQETLLEKLGKHKTGKVCLYINKLADINEDILTEIIKGAWNKALEDHK